MELNKNMIEIAKKICNSKEDNISEAEKVLCSLVEKAFDSNNSINNIQAYKDLNQLIVVTADEVMKPKLKETIGLMAEYKTAGIDDIVKYELNNDIARVKAVLSADNSGVNYTKLPRSRKYVFATPVPHQFGIKYNISEMRKYPVNEFKKAVEYVAESQVKHVIEQIYALAQEAYRTSKIPTKQGYEGAGLTLPLFRGVEDSLIRYGRNTRPVLIADRLFISNLASLQTQVAIDGQSVLTSTKNTNMFLTDDLRESLLRDVTIEQVSRSLAINIDNPFVDEMNSKVDLPVNIGIMIAGGNKPFRVTTYGTMTTKTDNLAGDIENDDVNIKITYKMDITLLLNRALGYIKDDTVTL